MSDYRLEIINPERRIDSIDGQPRNYLVHGKQYHLTMHTPGVVEKNVSVAVTFGGSPLENQHELLTVSNMYNIEGRVIFSVEFHILSSELRMQRTKRRIRDISNTVQLVVYNENKEELTRSEPIEVVSKRCTANKRADRILVGQRKRDNTSRSETDEETEDAQPKRQAVAEQRLQAIERRMQLFEQQLQAIEKPLKTVEQQLQSIERVHRLLIVGETLRSTSLLHTTTSTPVPPDPLPVPLFGQSV